MPARTLFLTLLLTATPLLLAQDPANQPETTPQTTDSGNYTPAPHTFSSDALHLRFQYPASLEDLPAGTAITHGRINLLGLNASRVTPGNTADLTACLRPLFFARTPPPAVPSSTTEQTSPDGSTTTVHITPAPVGSILLADLDTACLSATAQVTRTDLLGTLAQQFLTTPGMSRSAGPATYNLGYQRVTMAAAEGRPQTPPPPGSDPSVQPSSTVTPVFTMAVATNWSNHLLVWLLSSNQIELLNQLAHATVRFGRAEPYSLYPQTIGNSTPTETR